MCIRDSLLPAATGGGAAAPSTGRDRRQKEAERAAYALDPRSEACRRASGELLAEQCRLDSAHEYRAAREARRRLPAHAARPELLEALRSSRVIVVSGETGCGKSTQVPQFLLA